MTETKLSEKELVEQLETCWHLTTDDPKKRQAYTQLKGIISWYFDEEVQQIVGDLKKTMLDKIFDDDITLDQTPDTDGSKNVEELTDFVDELHTVYRDRMKSVSVAREVMVFKVRSIKQALQGANAQRKPEVGRAKIMEICESLFSESVYPLERGESSTTKMAEKLEEIFQEVGIAVKEAK